jgi:hypothetical protein
LRRPRAQAAALLFFQRAFVNRIVVRRRNVEVSKPVEFRRTGTKSRTGAFGGYAAQSVRSMLAAREVEALIQVAC